MPLIIKDGKDIEIISQREMGSLIKSRIANENVDPLANLPLEIQEKRRAILEQKAHREHMRVVDKERLELANAAKSKLEKAMFDIEKLAQAKTANAKVEAVSEITVNTSVKAVLIDTKSDTVESSTGAPDFMAMTKKEIDIWADTNLGVQLDRRHTKTAMIEALKKNL
jgi:hypothetical protein